MRYFPINLNIAGRKALVVGGGRVAHRKAKSLVSCGALVTAVSPEFCAGLARTKGVQTVKRRYRRSDLRGACLVVSATDSQEVNRLVWEHASAAGIPVNVVDQPGLCTFTVPAVVTRGDLLIAISTGGASPALSGIIRERLERELSPAYALHLKLLGEMRKRVLSSTLGASARRRLLKRMAGDEIHRAILRDGIRAARRLARKMLGEIEDA